MGRKEKWMLVIFIILCFLLPFGMVRNPLEIASRLTPLWISYYGTIWLWAYWGRPLWESFLACYGISALGIILIYFGVDIPRILFSWLKKLARMKKPSEKTKEKKNNKRVKLAKWLGRGGIGLILFFLFLPFPLTDPAAAIAMRLKKVKYGLWYLLAVDIPHVFLIVWGTYQGIEFFPSVVEFFQKTVEFLPIIIEFFKRLFM